MHTGRRGDLPRLSDVLPGLSSAGTDSSCSCPPHFEQVVDVTSPFLVTVIGGAGIGKSTLVEAFAVLRVAEGVTVLLAGCLP